MTRPDEVVVVVVVVAAEAVVFKACESILDTSDKSGLNKRPVDVFLFFRLLLSVRSSFLVRFSTAVVELVVIVVVAGRRRLVEELGALLGKSGFGDVIPTVVDGVGVVVDDGMIEELLSKPGGGGGRFLRLCAVFVFSVFVWRFDDMTAVSGVAPPPRSSDEIPKPDAVINCFILQK